MPLVALAVVLLAFAVIYLLFARDMKRARGRIASGSQTLETPLGTIEYGKIGDGPVILVVHGAGGGFDQGLEMTMPAVERGFQLIAPSRFGYLRSSTPPQASPAAQADAFAELLDGLGLEKVSVVAISAGAWSAIEFAVRHPDRCRALVLMVPAQALPAGVRNHGGALVRALFRSDFLLWLLSTLGRVAPAAVAPVLFATPASVVRSASAAERARLREIFEYLLPITARSKGMQFDLETARAPKTVELGQIACPVLTISALDDQFGTAARALAIAEAVSNGKAIIYPSGGHALVGRQAETIEEATTFLRGI